MGNHMPFYTPMRACSAFCNPLLYRSELGVDIRLKLLHLDSDIILNPPLHRLDMLLDRGADILRKILGQLGADIVLKLSKFQS
jgi:hypothetical protein